jgi:choline dehydrogenase-like flavoprotein
MDVLSISNKVSSWNEVGQPAEDDGIFRRLLQDLERENAEFAANLEKPVCDSYDVVIIGSGAGGGTLAYALRETGQSVLVVERGDLLPQEPENWDTDFVLHEQRYSNSEEWLNADGRPYQPYHYYYVGGQAKLYAATLLRFRERDFRSVQHEEGTSPVWPICYDDMEPHYTEAERLYLAHGEAGEDTVESWRSEPFPYPPIPVAPETAALAERLRAVGLHPFSMPQGIALASGGRCIFCAYCDSYPCRVLARGEPELCCIRPALKSPHVTLLRNAKALRLLTSESGRKIEAVEIEIAGRKEKIGGDLFVVSCGAVNSPVLLLRSANEKHPRGLANSSGFVGAFYMRHDITLLMAQHPVQEKLPQDHYWKAVGFNDFYFGGPDWAYPLGSVQFIGNYHSFMPKLLPPEVDGNRQDLAAQMLPLFCVTEDLPSEDNRVELAPGGHIKVSYHANNLKSHRQLAIIMTAKLKEAGCRCVTALPLFAEMSGGYHHCGTVRMGDDPRESVLDRDCKAHDVDNLYVVDASCFPSSSACNPMLTIAANALRVGAHLRERLSR